MSYMVKQVDAETFGEGLEPILIETAKLLVETRYPDGIGLLRFSGFGPENRPLGSTFVTPFGPSNSMKSLDEVNERNGRSPVPPPGFTSDLVSADSYCCEESQPVEELGQL